MCEPAQSTVLYADFQLDSAGHMAGIHNMLTKLGRVQRIGDYYMFSKLGAGHSLATRYRAGLDRYISEGSGYEGFWWNGLGLRNFREDDINLPESEREPAKLAAEQYYGRVCAKNMKVFRNWIEGSIIQSNKPLLYINRLFNSVLNSRGRDMANNSLRGNVGRWEKKLVLPEERIKVVRTLGKFLRRRQNFQDHFSDDQHIWN